MAPDWKGILLAGGAGTRLHPATLASSKQLLPVYDKPMVYYPLCTLLLAGIREILVISTPQDLPSFRRLLSDGAQWGVEIQYAEQAQPQGIAQALTLAADFVGRSSVALILGDNLFYGHGFQQVLARATERSRGATVFAYGVQDPSRYGVIEIDAQGSVISIEEKPQEPRSPLAIPGLYFYDQEACQIASRLTPSRRGELEITDVNRTYLQRQELHAEQLSRGFAWLDMGTPDSLLDASTFVQTLERRQGLKICCPEEVAFRQGFISAGQLDRLANRWQNGYGNYLRACAAGLPASPHN